MLYINLHCICCWRKKYFTKQKDDDSSFQLTFFSPKFSVFFVSNLPKRARCQEVRLKVQLWESQLLSQQCGEGKFEIGVLWSTEWGAILTMKKKNNAKKNKNVFFRMPFNLIYSSKSMAACDAVSPLVPGTFLRIAWQKRFIGCHMIFVSIVCSEQKKHHSNRSNEGLLLPQNC